MARQATHRWTLTGELVTLDALHVGGLDPHPLHDQTLARDGQGRLYLPGTSLTGALRTLCEREAATLGDVRALFGFEKRKEGHASFITIEDAFLLGDEAREVRQGVGIDRATGTAARKIKHDREVIAIGSRFGLRMVIEGPVVQWDKDWRATTVWGIDALRGFVAGLFERLTGAKDEGRPLQVGAAQTRGLGRVVLEGGEVKEHAIATPKGVLDLALGVAGTSVPAAASFIRTDAWRVSIAWSQRGPVYSKADQEGNIVDTLPVVARVEAPQRRERAKVAFVLPGASIKGVLRSHAERIVRTIRGIEITNDTAFLDQLKVPLVTTLFGDGGSAKRDGRRGALTVRDCHASVQLDGDAWHALTQASEDGEASEPFGRFREALDAAGLRGTRVGHHVAIDRWTGGAAEGLLFAVLETHGVTWRAIELEVDVRRLGTERDAALALLFVVLQDLAAGWLPLGFGGQRGMGEIEVNSMDVIRGGGTMSVGFKAAGAPAWPELDVFGALGAEGQRIVSAWKTWCSVPLQVPVGPVVDEAVAPAVVVGDAPLEVGQPAQGSGPHRAATGLVPFEANEIELHRARAETISLDDALEAFGRKAAVGIFYTPGHCHVGRWSDAGWRAASTQHDGSVVETALVLLEVYEARVFDGQRELRWLRRGGSGTAVLVAEVSLGLDKAPWRPETLGVTGRFARHQLVWGKVVQSTSGWSVVHEDRVGPRVLPLVGACKKDDRIGLAWREYVTVVDAGRARGNAYVAEERLVGFDVITA